MISNILSSVNLRLPTPVAPGSKAFRLLGLWVQIPQEACMSCVLSGRDPCVGQITLSEGSYQLLVYLIQCDLVASTTKGLGPLWLSSRKNIINRLTF